MLKDSKRHIGSSANSPFDVTLTQSYQGKESAFLWQEVLLQAGFCFVCLSLSSAGEMRLRQVSLMVVKLCKRKHLKTSGQKGLPEVSQLINARARGWNPQGKVGSDIASHHPWLPHLWGSHFKYLHPNVTLQFPYLIKTWSLSYLSFRHRSMYKQTNKGSPWEATLRLLPAQNHTVQWGSVKCPHRCAWTVNRGKGDQIIAWLPASNILELIYGNSCLKHSQPSSY